MYFGACGQTTSLHTAARRYCEERFSEWVGVYEDLRRKEDWSVKNLFKPGWDYSEEAYRTFPRYRVAKNTRIEIERLDVHCRMSLPEMRQFLISASANAAAALQSELTNKLAQMAIRAELEDFRAYVEALTAENGGKRFAEYVFHSKGEPIGDFRKAWASACVAAGLGKMVCPKCESEGSDRTSCRRGILVRSSTISVERRPATWSPLAFLKRSL